MMRSRVLFSLIGVVLTTAALAADWPQFRGPDRSGLSKETGLLKSWPESGPKLLWKATGLGEGHSTPSVARGRIFGMGLRNNEEVVWALDAQNGKPVWTTKIAGGITLEAGQGGYGPRATPTVDGDRLYTLGVGGELVCLSVADGKILWHKNLVSDFGGRVPTWGYCESPLVDGDRLIVTPGGQNAVVALSKRDGSVVWKSSGAGQVSYSSPQVAMVHGRKQYIQFLGEGVVGIDARDGKHLWSYDAPANRNRINCSMPIYRDGFIFAATAYQTGGGQAKVVAAADGSYSTEPGYFLRELQNHHGGMVLVGDHVYGTGVNSLMCIDFKTGKIVWDNRAPGKGSVTYADGMLYCRSERGTITLVEASPTEFTLKGRFEQPERSNAPAWAYPVVANGMLLIHDQDNLFCYEVKGK